MNLAPAYDAWLEEVEAKAIAEGKTEEQITIARRMLEINLPIETIAQVTGLSIEFLKTLRSNESSD
jgi:predicted transposase/invertase (TIGR01784 family)